MKITVSKTVEAFGKGITKTASLEVAESEDVQETSRKLFDSLTSTHKVGPLTVDRDPKNLKTR